MTRPLTPVALLLLGAALGNAQSAALEGGITSTTVQAQMVGRYFQVEALVNGKSARLIVDTGAGLNVLTPEAAQRFGIEGGIDIPAQGAGAATTPAKLVTVDRFQVGQAVVKGERAIVIELPAALQCDGLVGYSFLRHFANTFDYANAKLTFTVPASYSPPADAKAVDLRIVGNHPRVKGSVDGIEGWFTLDSGANGALTIMTPFVDSNGLREKHKASEPRITGKGVGGFAMGSFAKLGQVVLAGFALPPVPAVLSTQKQGAFAATDVVGNVGAEILNRFLFTLDYGAKKAYFAKTSDFDRTFRVDRSGLWIDNDKGAFKVVDVAPKSPAAEAGLRVGDEVVSLDGAALTSSHPLMVSRPLQGPAGTKVKIGYRRGGTVKEIELTLRDLD